MRQANVVRMHVGHDDPQNRQALQLAFKNAFPLGARFRAVDAAIHHRPALTAVQGVADQPQVDVVQGERQGHANPANTRRNLQRLGGWRQDVAQRIVKLRF